MPAPASRRRWVRAALVACGVAVVAALAWSGLQALYEVAPPAPPRHPHNASWRYGATLMRTSLYGALDGGDVGAQCRAALRRPRDVPSHFDLDEAVDGCRYVEWSYDN